MKERAMEISPSAEMTEAAEPVLKSRAAPRRRQKAQLGLVATAGVTAPVMSRWPLLRDVGLTSAQHDLRRAGIGGSDANIILGGDPGRLVALWREKRGEAEPEDLAGVLPVMLGLWTEAFNRQWYQSQTGNIVMGEGEAVVCPKHPWRRATLDGYIDAMGAVWEAKHVSAFAKPDEVLARYMPQLQHNMAVRGADRAILSVIYGNHKWEAYELAEDWLYQDELFAAEQAFWDCVLSGEPPVPLPVPPPPKPVAVREVCLQGNNAWASAAVEWLAHGEAAKIHANAVKQLKSLIEDDVSRAYGHGIEARRSKAGAISIREMA